jgi:hypothetical protein
MTTRPWYSVLTDPKLHEILSFWGQIENTGSSLSLRQFLSLVLLYLVQCQRLALPRCDSQMQGRRARLHWIGLFLFSAILRRDTSTISQIRKALDLAKAGY